MAAQSLIPGLIPDCSKIIESLSVLSQTSGVNKAKPQKGEKERHRGTWRASGRETDSESDVHECLGLVTDGHSSFCTLFKGEVCHFLDYILLS